MDAIDLSRATDPSRFTADVKAALAQASEGHQHGAGPLVSVRRDVYRGHEIVVRTTYEIEVDGRPLETPLMVSDRGYVLTHALPNYAFQSALDLVRQLIDAFPECLSTEPGPEEPGGGHHHHGPEPGSADPGPGHHHGEG